MSESVVVELDGPADLSYVFPCQPPKRLGGGKSTTFTQRSAHSTDTIGCYVLTISPIVWVLTTGDDVTETSDAYVVLLATGGTIASRARRSESGAVVAADSGAEVLATLTAPPAHPVVVIDVACAGSYLLTLSDMAMICRQIEAALADPRALGVVVTHGTDTMEETAYLADLTHRDARPVVFTGAQRAADAIDADGPRNLAEAITVAGSPRARGRGALIVFAGQIFPARGVRKSHTAGLDAFSNPDMGPDGHLSPTGEVVGSRRLARLMPFPLPRVPITDPIRVDMVSSHPNADGLLLRAALAAQARGIVLQATGSGNANPALCEAVAEATAHGVIVVVSSRVDAGPVTPIYGAGGGRDLVAAGAIPSGLLRPSQSMILLRLLLHLRRSTDEIREAFALHGAAVEVEVDHQSLPPTLDSQFGLLTGKARR